MSLSEQLEERAARLRQPGKQFTLGFFTQIPSPVDQPARRTYDELIESIIAAEEIGYDSVWIGQHHFSPEDGGVPSPLVVLAAAAARTKRIQLGTAVVAELRGHGAGSLRPTRRGAMERAGPSTDS